MTPTSGNPPSGGEDGPEPQTRNPAGAPQQTPYTPASTTVALSQEALCCDHRQNPPVGLRHPHFVHSGRRGAVFDAVHPSFVNRPCRTTITVWSTRAGRFVSLLADRALHFVPADLIVRWLGDQPPVSETATVIPARGATGLSMAIIAAPAFSSGMRSAISSGRSSRPSVIIASMAG